MPRDLSHVLHHFLPEIGCDEPPAVHGEGVVAAGRLPVALPLLALPIGDRDVVRAAFTWNLVVEIARLGGRAALVAPASEAASALWPEAGTGPLGAEVLLPDATSLGELHRASLDAAVRLAAEAHSGGVVLVRVPPCWLKGATDGAGLLRWSLLLTSAERAELAETYGLAKLLTQSRRDSQVGVTVHGAHALDDARRAFTLLARTAGTHLGQDLTSYGVLLDDLHVYRAIVSQRPIGLAHPQSRAARALRDVAEMLMVTARERALV